MSTSIPDNWYELLSARLHALESLVAQLHDEVREIKDDLQEAWLGGTESERD